MKQIFHWMVHVVEHFLFIVNFYVSNNVMRINSNIVKNLSAYFFASIITAILGVLVNPVLASKLSHEDYAIIGYYASFGTLLIPIVSFSLQSYYARNYFRVDEQKRVQIYNTLMSMFIIFGFAAFVIFFFLYYWYHSYFVTSISFNPFALLSFLPLYLSSYYNLYLMDLRMENKAFKYAKITVLNSLIAALLSILLVYVFDLGAMGRLVALLLTCIAFSLYSILIKKISFTWNIDIVKNALAFCWPLTVSGILSFFFLGIDRPMLEKIHDTYNLGLYNVGLQISSYLAIFGTVLLQTFDPDIYKYTSTNQHRKVVMVCVSIILLTLIPNLMFMFVSEYLIDFLTAGRYVESSGFANILCVKNVATTFAYVVSGVLIGYGYSKFELFNRIIGSVCSLLSYYFLITNYSFYGAAWGQSISWFLMGLISIICLMLIRKRNEKIKCRSTSI